MVADVLFRNLLRQLDDKELAYEYMVGSDISIYKHQELIEILKTVKHVHIYGFSFSEVDEDYMDWFFNNVSTTSQWEVSWFSDKDKNRIDKFVLDHWSLKYRLNIIKLEEIAETENY